MVTKGQVYEGGGRRIIVEHIYGNGRVVVRNSKTDRRSTIDERCLLGITDRKYSLVEGVKA